MCSCSPRILGTANLCTTSTRRACATGYRTQQTAAALGLSSPKPAPWEIIRLLVDGPVLSKDAALLEHDTLPADPEPPKATCHPRSILKMTTKKFTPTVTRGPRLTPGEISRHAA